MGKRFKREDWQGPIGKDGVQLASGNWMSAACWHRKGRSGACGGCYARTWLVYEAVQKNPRRARAIIKQVQEAMQAEGPKKSRPTPKGTYGGEG